MEMAPSGDAEPSLDLYTIPFSSGWFQWDEIHETEKRALPEFFEGVSETKNPRVYQDYRDFIINKYRENPTQKLKFTEIRKALIGDVTLLHKLYSFLQKWGLINFSVPDSPVIKQDGLVQTNVLVEEGPPRGLYVVPAPSPAPAQAQAQASLETSSSTQNNRTGEKKLNGLKLPPLTSYSDVFGEWDPRKPSLCAICGEHCGPSPSNKLPDGLKICSKCNDKSKNDKESEKDEELENTNNADNNENNENKDNDSKKLENIPSLAWTDPETLLLLEGVLKHGEDWDLIAQHVRTRNKTECIARLVQLPFGEHMLSSIHGNKIGGDKVDQPVQIELEKVGEKRTGEEDVMKVTGEDESPVKKKSRFSIDLVDPDSLMSQVGLLGTIAGPRVASAGAEAAIAELCNESDYCRELFELSDNFDEEENSKIVSSNQDPLSNEDSNMQVEEEKKHDTKMQEKSEEGFKSMAYKIRAGVATAFGSVAARAKLLADNEEREIEFLVSSIIQSQLKKMQLKMKHLDEAELIMEKERVLIQEQKGNLIKEWLSILKQIFQTGVPRWKDNFVPKLNY